MSEKDNLLLKIEEIISSEKTNSDIRFLSATHAPLIKQILSNYEFPSQTTKFPSAEMIFVAAPTGAGKETLVQKIKHNNPDKNYIILNMDIFRHYHNEIINKNEQILDINFAKQTNQTSFELYHIIQEIILREFPGTNIIVTGTMKDLEWVKSIISRYKKDLKTNYRISLATLAVPVNESAFSIFERYLSMVDERDSSTTPLRYTNLSYHKETTKDFISNVQYFEDQLHSHNNSYFDSIQVYRRTEKIGDFSEDTLIYDSRNPDSSKCAHMHIYDIMHNSSHIIKPERVSALIKILENSSNRAYLQKQGLLESIISDLKEIVSPQFPSKNKIEPLVQ